MKEHGYRHPREMAKDEDRVPVSTRVKVSTKERLEKAAKKHHMSLASLMAQVLDDYSEWLKKQEK